MMFVSPWPAIATGLVPTSPKQIFVQQSYKEDNFLELLVPLAGDEEKFFGTNVLNIFIASRFYGWVTCGEDQYRFDWPPPGFEETRARYLACRERFPSYRTLIWVDTWSAQIAQVLNPRTEWVSMMDQTDTAIQDFCSTTPGFEYMGRIESQVEPSYFQPYLDEFYTPTETS